jgi:cytidine deaminase
MDLKTATDLLKAAEEALGSAYAPYSKFRVGAALLAEDGSVWTGCNIENAAYPATLCAERAAAAKAVSEGRKRFAAVAVAGGDGEPCFPCGVCRQFLAEFATEGMKLVVGSTAKGTIEIHRFGEILPHAFKLDPDRGK